MFIEANVAMARVVMGDSVFGIMAIHTIIRLNSDCLRHCLYRANLGDSGD